MQAAESMPLLDNSLEGKRKQATELDNQITRLRDRKVVAESRDVGLVRMRRGTEALGIDFDAIYPLMMEYCRRNRKALAAQFRMCTGQSDSNDQP